MLTIAFRAPYYQYDFTFVDEAWWANGANILCQGGQLYVDIALDKNPPIFWFCAFLFKFFGISMNAIHIGVLLLVCLTSTLLFLLGTRFFSADVGAAAALIHAVASTTYYMPRIIGMNTETLMVLFSTAAAFVYLYGLLGRNNFSYFIAGLLASCAFLTKPVAITEVICLVFFLIVAGGGTVLLRLRSAAILVAGFTVGIGGFVGYLWNVGILWTWWDQAILYGVRYVNRISPEVFLIKTFRANLGFALIFAWLCLLLWLSRRLKHENIRAYWFAVFWLLSTFLGVAIGRRYYANYYIQVIPPLSLVGALGLVHLWRARHQADLRLVRRICTVTFLISFMWFHSQTLANWAALAFPELEPMRFWNMREENRRNREVATRLALGSSRHDRIFIWGSNSQLYFLADRSMATPWMDFDVADDYPPQADESWLQARTAAVLDRDLPRYIVDVQQNARIENFPDFRSLVEQHYRLESEVAGIRLFRLLPPMP